MRLALLAVALAAAAPAQALTIACGQVFDADSAKLLGPHLIEVKDGRIPIVDKGGQCSAVENALKDAIKGSSKLAKGVK